MRRAFGFRGFLVVIVVLAVGVSLLLPAVSKVRRAAVRTMCFSHLKHIGVAAHGFLETHRHFPPGTALATDLPPDARLSFYAPLLPYLEHEDVSRRLSRTAAWDAEPNRAAVDAARHPPKMFRCLEWVGERGPAAATGHLAVTNYVGVAGVGPDAATLPAGALGVGVFGYDRTTTLADITDGSSNTLLTIETGYEVGPWLRGGPATVRPIDPSLRHLTGDGRPFGGTHFRDALLRSPRPDGFVVQFADATARYVTNEVHPAVLAALATVAGKEELPADW
ncbi:MAG: hypothetical protein C0501_26635 [Isosphaera sp.]|nr:hypothetical protein [Isosphaera sp.]